MAHAKINLQVMLAWIEENLAQELPLPDDHKICERFGFTSTEQARTLLAELADAGRITIRGHGPSRTILLGRVKSSPAPIARVAPAVARSDPEVDAAAATIAAIVNRGRTKATVAANAGALLAAVNSKGEAAVASPAPNMETDMAGKSIMLPASAGSAIAAVERLSKDRDLPLGQAAAELIMAGLTPRQAPSASPPSPPSATLDSFDADELLEELGRRLAQARMADSIIADLAEANARAEAAEGKLAKLREALGA